jgi:tRNA 2-selenouridine synthase SelU
MFGLLFLLCTAIQQKLFHLCTSNQLKKHKCFRGPLSEHSYQVWFQFAQWFQRGRLKTDTTIFYTFGPQLFSFSVILIDKET